MRPWMGCLRRCSDAAASRYPSGAVVAEWRCTAAAGGGGAGAGAGGGGVREPGAVAGLPLAADQQRPRACSTAGVPELGGADAAVDCGQTAGTLWRHGDRLLLTWLANQSYVPSDLLRSTKSWFDATLATQAKANAIEIRHINTTITHKSNQS